MLSANAVMSYWDELEKLSQFSPALDKHPALKGKQAKLPDTVQAAIIKKQMKKEASSTEAKILRALSVEGGAAGMKALRKHVEEDDLEKALKALIASGKVRRHPDGDLIKMSAATATKTDPAKWEAAKREAKAKMGGKHSARAMQLATQIYKKKGGRYSGPKPDAESNSLKKWTKQKWKWSGGDKPGQGGKGVYLPSKKVERLKGSEEGRKKLRRAGAQKSEATREGRQYSSHGLAAGTSLKKEAGLDLLGALIRKLGAKKAGEALIARHNALAARAGKAGKEVESALLRDIPGTKGVSFLPKKIQETAAGAARRAIETGATDPVATALVAAPLPFSMPLGTGLKLLKDAIRKRVFPKKDLPKLPGPGTDKMAAAYRPGEYQDEYMLSTILDRLSNMSRDLKGRVDGGTQLPSWAEYKVYKGFDGILSALGSTYSGPHEKKAEVEYRGIKFPGYNKPIASNRKNKKKMVLVKRGDKIRLIHFGQKGYEDFTQHKDKKRRENYLKRSGGIRGKGGKLTANDPFSANYWARKELW